MANEDIQQKVVDYANAYGIDPNVALAQIARESSFNAKNVGPLGERGLGQFTADTWASYGYGSFDNAFDVDYNLTAWGNYMSALLGMFGWDYAKALQGYNGGPRWVLNGTVSSAAQGYAAAILAQAGAKTSTDSTGDIGLIEVWPGGYEQIPSWLKWAGIGLIAFLIYSAVSD
jgi:soluble lytic murein transglycosylase-like protein